MNAKCHWHPKCTTLKKNKMNFFETVRSLKEDAPASTSDIGEGNSLTVDGEKPSPALYSLATRVSNLANHHKHGTPELHKLANDIHMHIHESHYAGSYNGAHWADGARSKYHAAQAKKHDNLTEI